MRVREREDYLEKKYIGRQGLFDPKQSLSLEKRTRCGVWNGKETNLQVGESQITKRLLLHDKI